MRENPGRVKGLGMKFSADCAAIRATRGESGYSEAVDCWRTGVYTSSNLVSAVYCGSTCGPSAVGQTRRLPQQPFTVHRTRKCLIAISQYPYHAATMLGAPVW